MSLPETGKVLHKTGKELPVVPDRDQRAMYADAIAKSLRQALAAPGMSTRSCPRAWCNCREQGRERARFPLAL